MHDVAVYIRALRERQPGLTQTRAGKLIRVNRKTIERWEAGDNEPPATRLRDYVAALGGSVDYAIDLLLGRRQQPPSDPPGVVLARERLANLPPDVIEVIEPAVDALMRGRS